jgi:PKD repeat protein
LLAQATPPGAPIAQIKERVICCPTEEFVLDGWASIDLDGEIRSWLWDLNGDGRVDTTASSGELRAKAPDKPTLYTVSLQVKDNDDKLSAPATVTVHVQRSSPAIYVGADTTIKVGVRVFFEPRIEYNCGAPERFEWDFENDGKIDYNSTEHGNTSMVYYKAGRHIARFKLFDTLGRETGASRTITVITDSPSSGSDKKSAAAR